ncbi:MAG: hypothetical protein QF886_22810, partial [Planctomycetota bacterium]|nr:hypothetical protein [Planctomycetota bacterium]
YIKPAYPLFQESARQPEEEYQNEVVPWLLRQTQPLEANAVGEQASFQNILYASGPGDEQQFEARRVDDSTCVVKGTRLRNGKNREELALICLSPKEMEKSGIKTDASMFYFSPENVVGLNGTYLEFRKKNLLKPGALTVAQRKHAANFIEQLWRRAKQKRKPPELKTRHRAKRTWTFDGFDEHNRSIRPEKLVAKDGAYHAEFSSETEFSKVVLVNPADAKSLTVEFSNDGFQNDLRRSPEPELRSRIDGPNGKSFFSNKKLAVFEGQKTKSVRMTAKEPRRSKLSFEFLTRQKQRPQIVQLKPAEELGLIALTRDHQFALLDKDGNVKWTRRFKNKVLAIEPLDVNGDGKTEIVVSDSSSHLYTFSASGALIEDKHISTDKNVYGNYFRNNRPYALGLWRRDKKRFPEIVMGTYQSIAWIRNDGGIACIPENSDEGMYRAGYVWRGLVYWDRILKNGHD